MFFSKLIPAILIGFSLACSGGNDAGSGTKGNDVQGMSAASAADLPDPCSLITDQELSDFLFRSMEPDQRPAMQARNAQYVFTKRVENIDAPAGRTCFFQYRLVAADTTWREGDFKLRTLARQTFEIFANANPSSQDPIPGVGDQAFVFQNVAYARRGDVGVEVADFSSRNIVTEFLKLVVGRLP